ncbi:MAG: hypothetical protein H7144_11590, partial [Burkholderiales bacterium]|nr:hypothetical protein [Phycisphaerae bacterium]
MPILPHRCLRLLLIALIALRSASANAQPIGSPPTTTDAPRLKVDFGPEGLTSISYAGTILADSAKYFGDTWRVIHVSILSADGKPAHLWTPAVSKKEWDADRQTLTATYAWGVVQSYYTVANDGLDIAVHVTNTSGSDTIEGINLYPIAMRFPKNPAGFTGGPVMSFSLGDTPVRIADWGTGAVALANRGTKRPLYVGWMSTNETASTNRYELRIGSSSMPSQPTSWPRIVGSIPPGGS